MIVKSKIMRLRKDVGIRNLCPRFVRNFVDDAMASVLTIRLASSAGADAERQARSNIAKTAHEKTNVW